MRRRRWTSSTPNRPPWPRRSPSSTPRGSSPRPRSGSSPPRPHATSGSSIASNGAPGSTWPGGRAKCIGTDGARGSSGACSSTGTKRRHGSTAPMSCVPHLPARPGFGSSSSGYLRQAGASSRAVPVRPRPQAGRSRRGDRARARRRRRVRVLETVSARRANMDPTVVALPHLNRGGTVAMRIATYTRISTDEDRQPFSLAAQADRLENYVKVQDGWRIVRRFTDSASGATLERPGLRQALQEARAGVYELLLVYRVDRLSRNVRQLAQVADELEKAGVALRSATEPFDTSSPAGKMMLQMLGVFAEFERATIVERITAGMERAASQGRWVIGKVPYGYLRDKQTKLIHPHEPQADVVRRIFAMYVEGRMGAEAIAKALNAEGHRTKNGAPFARPIVLSVLNNPIYAGKIEFRGATNPGLHEPLVDSAAFEAAHRILGERGESQALRRAHPTEYLLSGVIRCGRCRHAYVGTSARGRRGLYHYYVCSTRYRYGTQFCPGERLPKAALEEAVMEQMDDVYRNSSLIEQAITS